MPSNPVTARHGLWPALLLMLFLTWTPALAHSGAHENMQENMPNMEMSWPTGNNSGMMMRMERPTTFGGRLVAWLGAWHPAVIHFPIALTLTVAFLEMIAAFRRNPIYSASNKILLTLAAAGAFAAALLGWADMGMPAPDSNWTQTTHRWLGTTIPFLLLLLWYLKRPMTNSKPFSAMLAALVVIILIQAYLGGEITHGANHMAF